MKLIDVDKLFNRKEIINKLKSTLNTNYQTEAYIVKEKTSEEDYVYTERLKGGGISSAN